MEEWGGRGSVSATLDGTKVAIDRGLPGERVVAWVDKGRKPWQGMAHQILEESPHRVQPPCPYYLQSCGGCQLQHLEYAEQLHVKELFVNREMARAGVSVKVDRVHEMDDPWRYRRTAAVAIGWEAGFRPKGRRGIVEIHDCLISHPLIGQFCHRVNGLLEKRRLPNYHGKAWLDCAVVGTRHAPSLQVLIQGIKGLTLESHPELPEVATTLASIEGVEAVAFRHRSGEAQALVGPLMSRIQLEKEFLYLPAGSFFQTNFEMLVKVLGRMREALAGKSVRTAADVYGGVGTLGFSLLQYFETLTLIELDSTSIKAAERTLVEWGVDKVSVIDAHAETVLGTLPPQDLVIVDPPRSGLGEIVTSALIANWPLQIFYLSCSPQSLAVDLAQLGKAGYRTVSLEMFDFYPQTFHVENLAILER